MNDFALAHVIGIDQSLTCTGVAVMDFETGALIETRSITPNPKDETFDRINFICGHIRAMVQLYDVGDVFVEQPIVRFARASGQLWRLLGAIIHSALPFEPGMVNLKDAKARAGGGDFSKEQMLESAISRWDDRIRNADEADACWICEEGRLMRLRSLDLDGAFQ